MNFFCRFFIVIVLAGFLLSFLPKDALTSLLQTDPLTPSVRESSNVKGLGDLGLFRNPYDDTNNPVGGIRDILPLQRNDEVNVDGRLVASNDYDGDWNRMDSVVGYEVPTNNLVDYNQHPHHLQEDAQGHYSKVPYQEEASTINQVAADRVQRQMEKKEKSNGL